MSFILDALRKSEHERQRQGSTEFATVPAATEPKAVPRWFWIVIVLLAVNLVVLAGLLLRPESTPSTIATTSTQSVDPVAVTPAPTPVAEPSFAERVARATQDIPQQTTVPPDATVATQSEADTAPDVTPVANVGSAAEYSTYQQVLANGAVNVAPLHLDIHVFSEVPEDRFVFINMSKYREGSQLDEGPQVSEIRPDGVLLDYRGVTFLLTRN